MSRLRLLFLAVQGCKTYIVAVAAVIYGIYIGSTDLIVLGLGLAGIRNGISTELAKIATSSTPVATAKQEAPVIAAEAVEEAVAAVK